jgi:hypothetical protein
MGNQRTGDFTVGRIIKPSVECTQRQDETVPASVRQRRGIGTRVTAAQGAPESDCGDRADLKKLVERQEDCGWIVGAIVDVDMKPGATAFEEIFRAIARVAGIERKRRKPEPWIGEVSRKVC